jgi:flagellar protein FlaG
MVDKNSSIEYLIYNKEVMIMRIGSQSAETVSQPILSPALAHQNTASEKTTPDVKKIKSEQVQSQQIFMSEEGKEAFSKEQLENAISTMNEFLDIQHKASKFVLHDGLDKYFVRLVDSETEEVIKEIPPERLLDAFYEMQKLAGMIVDEKI